jgi:hypothetical protein
MYVTNPEEKSYTTDQRDRLDSQQPAAGGWVGWDDWEIGASLMLDGKFTAADLEEIAALMRGGGPKDL